MKLVVVGGQERKVGKTAVMAGLIRGLNKLTWTAVKISQHGGDADSQDTHSSHTVPVRASFLLNEERDSRGDSDTSRYLAAGARRALWLRTRGGRLAQALPVLLETVKDDEYVMIESNRILAFLKPAVFLMVMSESGGDLKATARQFLPLADALVTVGHGVTANLGPGTSHPMLEDKPVFPVAVGDWTNPALCSFVGERLASARGAGDPHRPVIAEERVGATTGGLSQTEIQDRLKNMPEWSLIGNAICKKFTFKSFMPAIAFVNKIAEAAEHAYHHPDITINYNQVGISLSTHSESGVTPKDFQLAAAIDKIYASAL